MSIYIRNMECPICRKEGEHQNTCKICNRNNFDDNCFERKNSVCKDCNEKEELKKRIFDLENSIPQSSSNNFCLTTLLILH